VVKEEHKASHLIFIFTFSDERGENSPEADANMGRGRGAASRVEARSNIHTQQNKGRGEITVARAA
jgi:hypothetical protein